MELNREDQAAVDESLRKLAILREVEATFGEEFRRQKRSGKATRRERHGARSRHLRPVLLEDGSWRWFHATKGWKGAVKFYNVGGKIVAA